MILAVADTHAALWYLYGDPRLSKTARLIFDSAVEGGDQVGISSVTLVEIAYLVEKSRIPLDGFEEVAGAMRDPEHVFLELPVDVSVAEAVRNIPRTSAPDMPDRIVAATALAYEVPLLTCDRGMTFTNVRKIW